MSRSQVQGVANVALISAVAGIAIAVLFPSTSVGDIDDRMQSISEHQSWAIHAVLFAGLGMTVSFRLAAALPSRLTPAWLAAAALLIVIYATAGELAQLQVVGRSAAFGDWAADLIGALFGLTIAAALGPAVVGWLVRERA